MRGPVAFAVALVLALSFASPVAADRDCGDFATQAQAQAYFEAGGGSSRYNFDRLDADGDGRACDSLPSYGRASAGSSTTPRTPTPTPSHAILASTSETASTGSSNWDGWVMAFIFLGATLIILCWVAPVAWQMKSDQERSRPAMVGARPTALSSETIQVVGPLATLPPRPPSPRQPVTPLTPTNGYDTRTMPYTDYLQTSEWWAKRTSALRRANYRCQLCSRTDRLQVHHNTYERRGNEAPEDLIVLCAGCHEVFHRQRGLPPR